MARWIGRENVRKRLEAVAEGRTTYAAGPATFETADETIVVRPPFGLSHEGSYDSIAGEPLLEALSRDRVVAAVLVRLGGGGAGPCWCGSAGSRWGSSRASGWSHRRSARGSSRGGTRRAARRRGASAGGARSRRGL